MASPTVQTPILGITGAHTIIPKGSFGTVGNPVPPDASGPGSRYDRRALYIRNYGGSSSNMYVAFGFTATQGTKGEFEIIPGGEYSWNGLMPPLVGNVPIEYISIFIVDGNATGAVVEFI